MIRCLVYIRLHYKRISVLYCKCGSSLHIITTFSPCHRLLSIIIRKKLFHGKCFHRNTRIVYWETISFVRLGLTVNFEELKSKRIYGPSFCMTNFAQKYGRYHIVDHTALMFLTDSRTRLMIDKMS